MLLGCEAPVTPSPGAQMQQPEKLSKVHKSRHNQGFEICLQSQWDSVTHQILSMEGLKGRRVGIQVEGPPKDLNTLFWCCTKRSEL